MTASAAMAAEIQSGDWPKPAGQNTCNAKYTARFAITPTTAAVMAVSGAFNNRRPRLASTNGAPAKMKMNDGRKVKKVTTDAPANPASAGEIPVGACVQA